MNVGLYTSNTNVFIFPVEKLLNNVKRTISSATQKKYFLYEINSEEETLYLKL